MDTNQQIAEKIALIKTNMPKVYEGIQAQAKVQVGVFDAVRKALAGQANFFFAIEGRHVVGTPFVDHPIQSDVAALMAAHPASMVFMIRDLPAVQTPAPSGAAHGA